MTSRTYEHRFAPGVVPLRLVHDHLTRSPASAFWDQLPFHVPQRDDQSCGLASVTQVANALRVRRALEPIAQDQMAELVERPDWTGGVTLAELEALARRALPALGIASAPSRRHARPDAPTDLAAFRERLAALELGRVHLILNFALAPILGVPLGHHSPVGAFDAGADRVLVLDTFRQGWEPYWVPCALLWRAMCEVDADAGAARGYLVVPLPA